MRAILDTNTTSNTTHFGRISGLTVVDWLA
jgi:hypothetical protein